MQYVYVLSPWPSGTTLYSAVPVSSEPMRRTVATYVPSPGERNKTVQASVILVVPSPNDHS